MGKVLNTKTIKAALLLSVYLVLMIGVSCVTDAQSYPSQTTTSGIGLEGKISAPPPTQAPTIASPSNGAVFTNTPITITGFCPNGLLVKIFKNNVFSGSVMCSSGTYSLQADLFSAANQLVARAYDALDQSSPDSNTVTVTFQENANISSAFDRVILTSNYARRGANPKELLTWPIIISGGVAPYALNVDWGDSSSNDIYLASMPGDFNIKHTYEQSGVYRVLVKATDKNGLIAYLQLVAIGNGAAKQSTDSATTSDKQLANRTIYLWQPAAIAIPLIISTFWLGKRHEALKIKRRLQKGEHPFDS